MLTNQFELKLFFILTFFLATKFCVAQNPYYINIDKSSGLPANSVYDVFQDKKGFMWFATDKGLCRYDGNNFKTYSANFQTSKSGSSIAEDDFGRIWYSNFDGFLYFVKDGILQSLAQKKAPGYYKYGLIKDELFQIQNNFVSIYDLKTLQLKRKIALPDQQITFAFSSPDKFYVLGDFLYEFTNGKNYKKYILPKDFHQIIKTPILNFWKGELLINNKLSEKAFTFKEGTFKEFNFYNVPNFIQNTSISDGLVWFSTPNGIFKYENNRTIKLYFPEDNISSIYKDRQNNYWISTLNKGVLFVHDFSSKNIELPQNPITLTLGKEIYIGPNKNILYQLNPETLQIKTIFESKSNHPVNQIFADSASGQIFFTSFQFNILSKENKLDKRFSISIKDIKKVDEKYFSFAASGLCGIFYVDGNLKSFWDFIFEKNKRQNFSGFNQSLLLDQVKGKATAYSSENNMIYYATNKGLMTVNNQGISNEIKYKNESLYLTKLQNFKTHIYGLSSSDQFFEIDEQNKITLYPLPKILRGEKINSFRIQSHFVYFFTENAVLEYDLLSHHLKKTLSLSNEIEATDVLLKDNQLFLATSKGIVIKNQSERNAEPKPKLVINEILVNNAKKSAENLKNLNFDENDLNINFSILSFLPNEKYNLTYKLNNSAWKTLDKNATTLNLSSLSSGTYTVLLAVLFNNEKISSQKISFEINKVFWQKTWFIIGMILLLLLLAYSVFRWQLKKTKRENQLILDKINLEKDLNESKLIAIKSQMNPHFFYNALNTIQSFILSNDKKQALTYLAKFSALTRKILVMTEKENISIAEEVKTLKLYLDIEKARFEENFNYEINISENIDSENTKIPSMLLQVYIENALKHGLLHKKGLKNLEIKFSENQENILIEIIDNGIGREKSAALNAIKNKNHTSFATRAMKNRIDLLNSNKKEKMKIEIIDVYNQKDQSSGTKVSIKIPINF